MVLKDIDINIIIMCLAARWRVCVTEKATASHMHDIAMYFAFQNKHKTVVLI